MLRALEPRPGTQRLRDLLQRYRAEALSRQAALCDLQSELDHWQRETAIRQLAGHRGPDPLTRRCQELQAECDHLGNELSHVLLAITGVVEELQANDLRSAFDSVA